MLDNEPPRGGYHQFRGRNALPVWLRRAGYRTAHVGKYLNGYGYPDPREVPPGWDDWYATTNATSYKMFNFDLNVNGRLVGYGDRSSDYQTDVLASKASRYIAARARRGAPFFLSVAPVAPHRDGSRSGFPNPLPAPRHAGAFRDEPLPRPPSFNEDDVSDKPPEIHGRLSARQIRDVKKGYRSELESLLAVDDLVERLIGTLRRTGQLDDTVVAFTSDNGYFHGEHRLKFVKSWMYEEATRVPLLVRGPGFPPGATRDQLVANVDLAPTIVDLANASAERRMDGRSLVPLARDPTTGRTRDVLLEAHDPPRPAYSAIRTLRYVYAEYREGYRELYDLERDPFQLESVHDDPEYRVVRLELAQRLAELKDCAGASCR